MDCSNLRTYSLTVLVWVKAWIDESIHVPSNWYVILGRLDHNKGSCVDLFSWGMWHSFVLRLNLVLMIFMVQLDDLLSIAIRNASSRNSCCRDSLLVQREMWMPIRDFVASIQIQFSTSVLIHKYCRASSLRCM